MIGAKHIGVIGGGIAGNAIALFLSKLNYQITVLEKVAMPKPVGSGIMLQKPALAILEKLGLKEQVENNGCRIDGFYGINKNGKTVLDFDFKSVNENLYGVGVHRGSIFTNLSQAAEKDQNVTILYGQEVNDVKNTGKGVNISTVQGNDYSFDLVVVANGSSSMLRNCFPDIVKRSKMQNYAALWTTLPYDGDEFAKKISHTYHKSEYMYGLMPIGYNNNEHVGDPQINFFCAITKDFYDNWDESKFKKWKEFSYKIAPNYAQFIDQITDYKQLTATPYFDARLKTTYSDKVVFVGDACHALSPHLSAGTNLALMDVYELYLAIEEESSYQSAFKRYGKVRKQQIGYYYMISKIITPMFQSSINLSAIRDYVIPIFYKIPWTKRVMVETISGIRKNLFGNIDKEFYL